MKSLANVIKFKLNLGFKALSLLYVYSCWVIRGNNEGKPMDFSPADMITNDIVGS